MPKDVSESFITLPQRRAGRRPGRPSGAQGGMPREHLIDVALVLFAKQGIAETTLGEIAREAGVTPAMVHYYFKTREQLVDVLIDERFTPLRAELASVFTDTAPEPADALRAFARALVATVDRHPWFASLWLREVISESGGLRQRMNERFGDEREKSLTGKIRQWQQEGKLNPDLEPSLVFSSLFGLTVLPLATRKWDDHKHGAVTSESIARHAVALLTHGIGPR
jgi:TetR/AcrR family transcriptional regulator